MVKIDFYKDGSKKAISPVLFSDFAQKAAEEVAKAGQFTTRDGMVKLEKNKRTQIRKFYDEVVRLNGDVKNKANDWDTVLPFVNMLIAKTTYAYGRKLVTKEFLDLMNVCVAQIEKPEDLDVFCNFFEAFMGFYKQYE